MRHYRLLFFILLPFFLLSCSKDDGVTLETQAPYPQSVMVMVDGRDVANATILSGMGSSTVFVAQPSSRPPGLKMWMEHSGPSMMHGPGPGPILMYDDGTHGDPRPGDGEYCYEDHRGRYGVHMGDAPHGQHEYQFYCEDGGGRFGPRVRISVTVQ